MTEIHPIRHTILFKVKTTIPNESVVDVMQQIYKLRDQCSGMVNMVVGECHFHDENSVHFFTKAFTRSMTHAISIDFCDKQALAQFFNDPGIQSVKNHIVNIAEGGYEGIIGFDWE